MIGGEVQVVRKGEGYRLKDQYGETYTKGFIWYKKTRGSVNFYHAREKGWEGRRVSGHLRDK